MTTFNFNQTLVFLDELEHNNYKAWFDSHRADYEEARATFTTFIDALIDEFREADHLEGLAASDCMMRINRDIRFTKDKSPYHTNLTALIAPGGRRSMRQGYYVAIGPHDRSMAAGGLHMATSEQITRFRQAIDRDASEFKAITHAPLFIETFGGPEGERLKSAPQGYRRDHPDIDLLRLKEVTVIHRFADTNVLRPGFLDEVLKACRAMRPFLDYIDKLE